MIRYLSPKDIVQIHLLMMNRYGEGERLTLGVATGDIDIEESTKWFEMHCVPYQR